MNSSDQTTNRQTTDSLLMIRPASFGFNEQTASSNAFQKPLGNLSAEEIRRRAQTEFDNLVEILRAHEINVFVVEDTPVPPKPDAVFPNNWISFHHDGTVFLYPMLSEKRNAERRADIIATLRQNFQIEKTIDLAAGEIGILEGTGSMVCDHVNRVIYSCLSPRTDENLLKRFASMIDYEPIVFHCLDGDGAEIYHTNVVMCVGETLAVICLDTIKNSDERNLVIRKLAETNHEVIGISVAQMNCFAGNMLEVRNNQNKIFLLMSASARESLTGEQTAKIESHAKILSANIETIETIGGGSVRCMLAEIFARRNKKNLNRGDAKARRI